MSNVEISENDQLKGVVISIDSFDYDDDGNPYSITRVYRGDLEGPIDDFMKDVSNHKQVVEFSQMKNM